MYAVPSRFELSAQPGQVLAQILEIGNDETAPGDFSVRTADWTYRADSGVDFRSDTLAPGSCRPWVRIERPLIKVGGHQKRRYRFEVHIPEGAAPGLCRFALLVEPADDGAAIVPSSGLVIPIHGQLGVIVYVRVGGSRPVLAIDKIALQQMDGRMTPVAMITNSGTAHGRAEGLLTGTDATGRPLEFTVSNLPILPGETRAIPIWAGDAPNGKPPVLKPPVNIHGSIEWEGGRQKIDALLDAVQTQTQTPTPTPAPGGHLKD